MFYNCVVFSGLLKEGLCTCVKGLACDDVFICGVQ